MINSRICLLLVCFLTLSASSLWAQSPPAIDNGTSTPIPLHGIWKFKLDPFDTGVNSNGVQLLPQLPETITLPGSTRQLLHSLGRYAESGACKPTEELTMDMIDKIFN